MERRGRSSRLRGAGQWSWDRMRRDWIFNSPTACEEAASGGGSGCSERASRLQRHRGPDQNVKAVEAQFVLDAELAAEIGAVEGDRRFGEADYDSR